MADNVNTGPSWWSTLPGIFTAIAGLVTAISGLVVVLYQNGILGDKPEAAPTHSSPVSTVPPSNNVAASASGSGQPGQPTAQPQASASAAPASTLVPWGEAQAIITTDKAKVTVKADSLRNCISSLEELTLVSGQDVPFSKLRSIEVKNVDSIHNPSAKAALVLTMLDGTQVEDSIEAQCDIFAYNATGRFSTFWQNVSKIEFSR